MAERIFLALGSDLGDRLSYLQQAVDKLSRTEGLSLIKKSSVYRTLAWGVRDQTDYYNAVIEMLCQPCAPQLLQTVQRIELDLGRERHHKWAARTLDIDILLFGGQQLESEDLTVPHPLLSQRLFVLCPLAELAPEMVVPGLGRVDVLLQKQLQYEKKENIKNKIEQILLPSQW